MSMANELLLDAFQRVRESVHGVVEGLSADQLAFRIDGRSNSIAWLVWHLARVEDGHIADLVGSEHLWTTGGWYERFGLPFGPEATGYGQSGEEVAGVRASGELLLGYHDAAHEQTVGYLEGLSEDDLDRVVDERWDPPVTLAVRLVSVVNDATQHAGQAGYVRGLLG